jgi:TctA family transporter
VLNIPLIGVWVKLLRVPYRLMFPAAVFFICIGVYSVRNELFDVGVVAVFGALGALFMSLDFPVAPIILGFVLGPMLEENFRRALLLSYGHLDVFVKHPISAAVLGIAGVILLVQVSSSVRASLRGRRRMAGQARSPA